MLAHVHVRSCPPCPGPALLLVRCGGARQRPVVCDGLGEEGRSAAPSAARREVAGSRWGCRGKGGVRPRPCPQSPPGPGCPIITLLLTPAQPSPCWTLGPDADPTNSRVPRRAQGSGRGQEAPAGPTEQRGRGRAAWAGGGVGGACPDSLPCGQMASHLQSPPPPARPGLAPPRSWRSVVAPCAAWQATPGRQAGGCPSQRGVGRTVWHGRPAGPHCRGPASHPVRQAPLF